jgi:hypothetical protein
MSFYKRLIVETLKINDEKLIEEVEDQMRNQCGGVLDHLTKRRFQKEAKIAYEVVKLLQSGN